MSGSLIAEGIHAEVGPDVVDEPLEGGQVAVP